MTRRCPTWKSRWDHIDPPPIAPMNPEDWPRDALGFPEDFSDHPDYPFDGPHAKGEYEPPTVASDTRVCGHCREAHEDAIWFPIKNDRTGKYHSGGDYGVTDCGVDATEIHWLWPV